jgi:phage antirepressor YoqD-like protein
MSFGHGQYASQARRLLQDQAAHARPNTIASYNPRIKEFREYCQAKFSNLRSYAIEQVTEEKLFGFLFYQAYQKKRQNGRKKEQQQFVFDPDDFDHVMSQFNDQLNQNDDVSISPDEHLFNHPGTQN